MKCCTTGCAFQLALHGNRGSFIIGILNPHKEHACLAEYCPAMAPFLDHYIKDWINKDKKLNAPAIVKGFFQEHLVNLKNETARLHLKNIKESLVFNDGDLGKLVPWKDEFLKANPGSFIEIKRDASGRFYGVFVAIGVITLTQNFNKQIGAFDGTHIKNKQKGTILIAMTKDVESHILPIAFAVIADTENESSWTWFLQCLNQSFANNAIQFFEIVCSDRDKGLIPALKKNNPTTNHFYCTWHLEG